MKEYCKNNGFRSRKVKNPGVKKTLSVNVQDYILKPEIKETAIKV